MARQVWERRSPTVFGQKAVNGLEHLRGVRFLRHRDVVAPFEWQEAGARHEGRKLATGLEWYGRIAAPVDHQRWNAHLRRQVPHVEVHQSLEHRDNVFGRGGGTLELAE
jgi:hypothetical protein